MTSIQPQLWVARPGQALAFYQEAFGARILHRVGEADDIVAQLVVGEASFWVGAASSGMGRFSPMRSVVLRAERCSWLRIPTPL
jgi:uncharacterized glyoxalase superfamily protein PhnB